jgi:hypothetical protein
LAGSRGRWECGILELVQALGAFVDECGTEVVLEEGDGEGDTYGEADDELDPEEEREGLDEATIANDRTDVANQWRVQNGGRQAKQGRKTHPRRAMRAKTDQMAAAMMRPVLKPPWMVNPRSGPFMTMYQSKAAVPAEDNRVRRERMNTPKRTGKQQQKCFDISVEFVVLDVDWEFARAL